MTKESIHIRFLPHVDTGNSLIFPVMEYELKGNASIKIGRTTADKRCSPSQMTFRSKVVSRGHAVIFIEKGNLFIRDTQSSSGTFLNNRRLCPPNEESNPFKLKSNDIIQLGVDYKGGTEEIFRCVRMRLEIKDNNATNNNIFYLNSYRSLQQLTTTNAVINKSLSADDIKNNVDDIHVDECCICLFAIAPLQALFIAPCSHKFHYICLRPLLVNHPAFSCPLCRHYSDLSASVSVEVDEVKIMILNMNEH
ncbi:SMAD/FHA domain-containing protein [Pilobolus umbonatus]|nr:SMAD/FHA domain-containing protein [Pilobolus umbonatus]